jgi:uncharacterized zinc-type alcohol dehydrogenase-like protein
MTTIEAYAALSTKDQLQPFTYAVKELKPYEVLIEVTHCGICHSDIHLIDDDWQRSIYPLVAGHEVVGKIVEIGSMANIKMHERVGVSWLYSSCLECPTCLSGNNHVCPDRKATCIGHHGGFAKYMTADSRFVYKIPKNLSSAIAAPLLCAGATVYAPIRRLKIQAPHQVAVLGIGGLGHLAIKFCHAFGCKVTAISSMADKKEEAIGFGASDFITLDELKKDLKKTASRFDFILSTTHADLDWNLICSLLKPTGTLCFLGRPHNQMLIDPSIAFGSDRSITGSAVANRFMIQEMLQFCDDHKIEPQIELFKMSNINQAIERVRKNLARYRIVLEQD